MKHDRPSAARRTSESGGALARRLRDVLPWTLLALAMLLVAGQIKRPAALWSLWRPWTEVATVAIAMTPILLTGGIDLSVGSIVALSGVVLGVLWQDAGWPIGWAVAAALGTGALAGGLNGGLVALGIAPLVATLATMAALAGLALELSQGRRIPGLPGEFCAWGQGNLLGLPTQFVLLAVVAAVAYVVVHHTRIGRQIFAWGDNPVAARFAAVRLRRLACGLYLTNGLVAALVGVWTTARGGAASPTAGAGLELEAIACVVLGGTRVTGGFGGVGRTLLGAAVLAHLDIGLQLWGARPVRFPWLTWTGWSGSLVLDADARLILIGLLVILVAVWNDRLSASHAGRATTATATL